jgi:hypothetical protein
MKNVTVIETELRNSLPALAELINKELGFAPELRIEMSINHRYGNQVEFSIESNNLINELGNTLVKTIFSTIQIGCWSAPINEEEGLIGFFPRLRYSHPNGGSNGTDFIWNVIYYKIDTCTWIAGRSILNQNNEF